ncbi:DMT family transporter [Rhodococcus sp. NPDC056960]|uniref:DMT family transporter n=1 Tax=Rhodococcus sp. NPDC056960 TaxID=3345982 RepID=UPI0036449D62
MLREKLRPSRATVYPAAQSRHGFTLVLVGAVLWGSNGVTGALTASHSEMSWAAIVALRMAVGGLAMLAVTFVTGELRRLHHNWHTWRTILLTAGCSVVFAGGYFQALEFVGVAVATVVSIGASAVFITVVATVRDRRWPSPSVAIALVASLIGLVLVCTPVNEGWSPAEGRDFAVGITLSTLSGLAFGAQTLVNSRPVPGLNSQVLVGVSFTIAGILCMPWAAASGFAFDTMTPTAWTALALLTFVSTLLGFIAYYAGLHRGVHPTTAGVSTAVEPVVAGVLAVLVLGEHLTVLTVAGMALILTGVLLVRPHTDSAEAPTPPGP